MITRYIVSILTILCFHAAAFSQVPANDECNNAVNLITGINSCNNPIIGTTRNATRSANLPLPYCSLAGINDDVWYKLSVTSSGILNLNFTNTTTGSSLYAMVYTGTCDNLEAFYCSIEKVRDCGDQ